MKVFPFARTSPDRVIFDDFVIFPESTLSNEVLPPPLAPRIAVNEPVLQEPVHKHPWNKSELAKGRITEVMGYVCRSLELPNIFSESEHGCCELFKKRKINDRN